MGYSEINFGLDVLVSVIFGTGGALAVWFKMKGQIDIMEIEQDNSEKTTSNEITYLKQEVLTTTMELKQITRIMSQNKSEAEMSISLIKEFILQMKIDIIQEIHNKK